MVIAASCARCANRHVSPDCGIAIDRGASPLKTVRMSNLTKREIVLEIYRKTAFPQKQIVDTVQQTLDIVQRALANGRNVELRNFGVLEVQVRKQRIGRNPNKPEAQVVIPQRAVVKFKSGKILKQQLKKIDLAKLLQA